jgi:hypothetical protein
MKTKTQTQTKTQTSKTPSALSLFLLIVLLMLTGCGGASAPDPTPPTPPPLSASNLNLIFVVSEDLAFHAPGDVSAKTANLTSKGLQRALGMATFLQRQVLGSNNVTGVYTLAPMTHLQTSGNYPDMASLETIQQFALRNKIILTDVRHGLGTVTGNSFPLNASYGAGPVPSGVVPPPIACANCQGLDFADHGSDNEAMVSSLIKTNQPGFYVFSAPWETINALLAGINNLEGDNLALPATYAGPNFIYAISITPSGAATLTTFNTNLNPPNTYPALPPPKIVQTKCTEQQPFSIAVTGGQNGAVIPGGTNTNETVYLIRHAEAHPISWWEDGNYVCAGQWRALDLPNALRGKIMPDEVYSIDPAQVVPGSESSGYSDWSYVRPSLTVEPYAIANELPYYLVGGFGLIDADSPRLTSDFFFNGGQFSNHTVLLAWEHDHFPPTINALLASYSASQTAPDWPDADYDTIWTVTLDSQGNLSVNNAMCEGIDSAALPKTCPEF